MPGTFLSRLLVLSLVALATSPAIAQPDSEASGQRFAIVTLHDVDDRPERLGDDGVSSERLVALFDWLAGNGWTAITLDDVERARSGDKPLPKRAILITVDDGYRSLYTRVFPLALAYRMPIVAALVGSWLDVPAGGTVLYDETPMPRSHFITWDQAREMQASGLVEFASHSYDLHRGIVANPQGNKPAAAVNRRYTACQGYEGYEDDATFRARLLADLQRSRDQLRRELGRAPRAVAWPYGRYGHDCLEAAREVGFRFALTLDPQPADARQPMTLGRYLPSQDSPLGDWVANLRFNDPWPSARRIVSMDPATFASPDPSVTNDRLGQAIERLVALGATHVLIDAAIASPDGGIEAAWFPNSQVPMRQDLLSRLAAQTSGRAGVAVIVRLPHRRALKTLGDPQRVLRLFRDLGVAVQVSGLMVEEAPSLSTPIASAADMPWDVLARRRGFDTSSLPPDDALALRAFDAVSAERPWSELVWMAPPGHPLDRPSALAEVTLVPTPLSDAHAGGARAPAPGLDPATARRIGLWWTGAAPPSAEALARATHTFQVHGGTIVGWQPDAPLADQPAARIAAPVVSAARFPPPGSLSP